MRSSVKPSRSPTGCPETNEPRFVSSDWVTTVVSRDETPCEFGPCTNGALKPALSGAVPLAHAAFADVRGLLALLTVDTVLVAVASLFPATQYA